MEEYTTCGPQNYATQRACFHHLSRPRMTAKHNGYAEDFEPVDCFCLDNRKLSIFAYEWINREKCFHWHPLHFNCFNSRKENPFESTVTTAWGWNNMAALAVSSIFLCRIKVSTINIKCIIWTESKAWGTHNAVPWYYICVAAAPTCP